MAEAFYAAIHAIGAWLVVETIAVPPRPGKAAHPWPNLDVRQPGDHTKRMYVLQRLRELGVLPDPIFSAFGDLKDKSEDARYRHVLMSERRVRAAIEQFPEPIREFVCDRTKAIGSPVRLRRADIGLSPQRK